MKGYGLFIFRDDYYVVTSTLIPTCVKSQNLTLFSSEEDRCKIYRTTGEAFDPTT